MLMSLLNSAVLAVEVANHKLPTEHDTLEIVSTESLECELNLVRAGAAGSLCLVERSGFAFGGR